MDSVFLASMNAPLLMLAAAIELAGLVLVHRAWRRRGGPPAVAGAGWALVAGSLLPWILGAGPGRGVALAFAALALAALVLIAGGALTGPAARSRRREAATRADAGGDRGLVGRTLARTLVVGPLGFGVAAAGAALVYGYLPGADGNRLITAFLVLVFGWGGIMAWTSAAPSLRRPAMSLGVTLGVAVLLLLPLLAMEASA